MLIANFSIGYIEELAKFIINSLDSVLSDRITFTDFSIYQNKVYLKFSFIPSVADSPFLRCKQPFKPYKAYNIKLPKSCAGMPTDDDWRTIQLPIVYDSNVNENGFVGLARHHQKKFFPELDYQASFTFNSDTDLISIDEDTLRDIRLDLDEYARLNLMSMAHIEVTQVDD